VGVIPQPQAIAPLVREKARLSRRLPPLAAAPFSRAGAGIQPAYSVSTFKVASWGPIALKGPPGGLGLAAGALHAEPIMGYGGEPARGRGLAADALDAEPISGMADKWSAVLPC
jgi:hypothetical protein